MWNVTSAAKSVVASLPKAQLATTMLAEELVRNAQPSMLKSDQSALATDGLMQVVSGKAHHSHGLVLRERHDLLRGKWLVELTVNDSLYTIPMRVEPIDEHSLRLTPAASIDEGTLAIDEPLTELKFHTRIDDLLFSALDYGYLGAQLSDIPDSQTELQLVFDRQSLPTDTCVIDRVMFVRQSAAKQWSLTDFEVFINTKKRLVDSSDISGKNHAAVTLIDIANPKRFVEVSRYPPPLPNNVVMIEFNAANDDEQVLHYFENAMLMMSFFYEPVWFSPSRWRAYGALYHYVEHFFEHVVPKLVRDDSAANRVTSNHDLDKAWRNTEVPRIWEAYKASGQCAERFLGLDNQSDIRIDTLSVPLWGLERDDAQSQATSNYWLEVVKLQERAHGKGDAVVDFLRQEVNRENLYRASVHKIKQKHMETVLGQWVMFKDTSTGRYYETRPGVNLVLSRFIVELHMHLFDQHTSKQFSLPLVCDFMPFEAVTMPPPSCVDAHVYKRVFRAEGDYEVLISAHSSPLFVVLNPDLEVVPHRELKITHGTREDYPAPLYVPYERKTTEATPPTTPRSKASSPLSKLWAFFFGTKKTDETCALEIYTAAAAAAAGTAAAAAAIAQRPKSDSEPTKAAAAAFDFAASWLEHPFVMRSHQQQDETTTTDARIDDAEARLKSKPLDDIMSVLQYNTQSKSAQERLELFAVPANTLLLDNTSSETNPFVVTLEALTSDMGPFRVLRLSDMQEVLVPLIANYNGHDVNSQDHLLLTRDPRVMVKTLRRIMFTSTKCYRDQAHSELALYDVEPALVDNEREVRFVLSDGRRLTAAQIATLNLGVFPFSSSAAAVQRIVSADGFYSYSVVEEDCLHTGVLFAMGDTCRILTRDNASFITEAFNVKEPHNGAVFWRMSLVPLADVEHVLPSIMEACGAYKVPLSVVDDKTKSRAHVFIKQIVADAATFSVQYTFGRLVLEVQADAGFYQPHTQPDVDFSAVTSNSAFARGVGYLQNELITARDDNKLQANAHSIRHSLHAVLVRVDGGGGGAADRVCRIEHIDAATSTAVGNEGTPMELSKLRYEPFPLFKNVVDNLESSQPQLTRMRSDYLERIASEDAAAGDYATYSVFGWPAEAPPLRIASRRLLDSSDILMLYDGDDPNASPVHYAFSAWDLIRHSAASEAPVKLDDDSVRIGHFHDGSIDDVIVWINARAANLKVWDAPKGARVKCSYLVDPSTAVVYAVKFGDSPAVPVLGEWTEQMPDPTSSKDIDADFSAALTRARYDRHTRLPSVAYYAYDYGSAVAPGLDALTLLATDPRRNIVESDEVVIYVYELAPTTLELLIAPATQQFHTMKGVKRGEEHVRPVIVAQFATDTKVLTVQYSADARKEVPFDVKDLSSLGKVEKLENNSQNNMLGAIQKQYAPVDNSETFWRFMPRSAHRVDIAKQLASTYPTVVVDFQSTSMLLYVGPDNNLRRMVFAVMDMSPTLTNSGPPHFYGVISLHITKVLQSINAGETHDAYFSFTKATYPTLSTAIYGAYQQHLITAPVPPSGGGGGGGAPQIQDSIVSIERNWNKHLDFLLLCPQDLHKDAVMIVDVRDATNRVVISELSAQRVPVLVHLRTNVREALMLLPPYNLTRGTRLGHLPTPSQAVGNSTKMVVSPLVLPLSGHISISLHNYVGSNVSKEKTLVAPYTIPYTFTRTTPAFALVLTDPQDNRYRARMFIEIDKRSGKPVLSGVSFEFVF